MGPHWEVHPEAEVAKLLLEHPEMVLKYRLLRVDGSEGPEAEKIRVPLWRIWNTHVRQCGSMQGCARRLRRSKATSTCLHSPECPWYPESVFTSDYLIGGVRTEITHHLSHGRHYPTTTPIRRICSRLLPLISQVLPHPGQGRAAGRYRAAQQRRRGSYDNWLVP